MILKSAKQSGLVALLCAGTFLAGCTMDGPTALLAPADRQMQVTSEASEMQWPTSAVDENAIIALASDYKTRGDGAMLVSVLYDPASRSATAMKAGQELNRIVNGFKKHHVTVQGDVLPVQGLGHELQALITYDQLYANASPACQGREMDASLLTDLDASRAHTLGCTVDNMIARQTANPADLLGRDPVSGTDGRRGAIVTEAYRGGVPAPELRGESASEN